MGKRYFLSPKGLAEMLNVDVTTVYGWTSTHQIPYTKIGRLVRFRSDEIEKWLEERRVAVKDFA